MEEENNNGTLMITLGRDAIGNDVSADILSWPHALVGGALNSGKTMFLHALLNSLVTRYDAEHLRLVLAGATGVDLGLYDHLPHMLTPAIAEPRKVVMVSKWLRKEMERRYEVLRDERVRDIDGYHRGVVDPAKAEAMRDPEKPLPEAMPYIVVVIDEVADAMRAYGRELEAALVPVLQNGRAAGISIIIATSSDDNKVISAGMRPFLPARVTLAAGSAQSQKFFLGMSWKETVQGPRQALYRAQAMEVPVRIEVPLVSSEMLEGLMSESRLHRADSERMDVPLRDGRGGFYSVHPDNDVEEEDDLYGEAKRAVIEMGKASPSYLQRKLGVGYARAAKLMDLLEEGGVIGPADGSKPRNVLASE